jgi:hypothetical protein
VWGGHPQGDDDAAMAVTDGASVAEIVLDVRASVRLTAGFAGWDVERGDDRTVLRRVGATGSDVRAALAEVRDLGLELESFRRLERI